MATAASYLSRVYRRDLIRAKRPEFRATIVRWLRESAPKEEDAILGEIADDIINTIMGAPDGRTAILGNIGGVSPRARGPLKERTFNIPDALIEDFLESNVQVITNRYIRTMAADIEFAREFGEVDPVGALKNEIRDETNSLISGAKSEKERTRLSKEGEQVEAMIEDMVNQLRGVGGNRFDARYAGVRSTLRFLRNLNFARLLGGVVISSISDVGLIVMQEGLARTLGTVMTEFGRGFKGTRMAATEAQTAGTALDMFLSTRVRTMLDLGERYEFQTGIEKFERGTQGLANIGANVFLINHWNTALKSITSMMAGTRILDTARKIARGQGLTKFETRRLAQAGITPDIAQRMADQAKHWSEVGEGRGQVLIANAERWTDREAADVFLNALLRDVDNAIITPGVGDAPLWTSGDWGKSIFQFKKFASASTQRILISGLQARDMATMNGLLAIVGLGALGTAARDMISTGEVRDRNTRQWAADAVDRSGAVAMFYEMDAMLEKSLGTSPITAITGQEVSRFAGRGVAAQILGPSVGIVEDAGQAVNAALSGEFTQTDLHKVRRLMPLQNVFYARWMFDQMEQGIARAFNLPKKQPRRRRVAAPTFGE